MVTIFPALAGWRKAPGSARLADRTQMGLLEAGTELEAIAEQAIGADMGGPDSGEAEGYGPDHQSQQRQQCRGGIGVRQVIGERA